MKLTKSRGSVGLAEDRIAQLERLVDELIKDSPQESRIKAFMTAAGLEYSADPIIRMEKVLATLDGVRGQDRMGRKEHDRNL